MVTILPETAQISGSRILMRGAAFTAENIKAKKVWTDADGDLTISFAIRGEDLAFDNQAAPNVSSWLEVDRLEPRLVRTKEGKYSHRHGLYSTRNLDFE